MPQDRHAAIDVAADQKLLGGVSLRLDRVDGPRMPHRLQEGLSRFSTAAGIGQGLGVVAERR